MRFPAGIAAEYRRQLLTIIKHAESAILDTWEKIKPLVEENEIKHAHVAGDAAAMRTDAPLVYRVQRALDDLGVTLNGLTSDRITEPIARQFVQNVSKRSEKDLNAWIGRALRSAKARRAAGRAWRAPAVSIVGSMTPQGRAITQELLDATVAENVALIKSIPRDMHKRVEQVVLHGVTQGQSTRDIANELQKTFQLTRNRADLIATDQTGSFYGKLNKTRMRDVGLKKFVWRTAGDARVRPKHQPLDGKIFTWEKGALDGIYPGSEIRCRCVALPVEEEVINRWAGTSLEEPSSTKPVASSLAEFKKTVAAQRRTAEAITEERARKLVEEYQAAQEVKDGYVTAARLRAGWRAEANMYVERARNEESRLLRSKLVVHADNAIEKAEKYLKEELKFESMLKAEVKKLAANGLPDIDAAIPSGGFKSVDDAKKCFQRLLAGANWQYSTGFRFYKLNQAALESSLSTENFLLGIGTQKDRLERLYDLAVILGKMQKEADRLGLPRIRALTAGVSYAGAMGDGVLSIGGDWFGMIVENAKTGKPIPRELRGQLQKLSAEEEMRGVLWHEFAHHLHQRRGVVDGATLMNPPLERRLEDAMKKASQRCAREGKTWISVYGSTNPHEWFAENVGWWKTLQDKSVLDPEVLQILKEEGMIK